jgi:prophage DNA circulation protein
MDDTPQIIRQQMDETRSHLSEKLESLENQVSETVQSTGTAVNATVEAVQETVETVTGAVQGAVESVSNAFDIRRQMERHPLLVLGGAAVLGYLAGEHLAKDAKKAVTPGITNPPFPPVDNASDGSRKSVLESAAIAAAIAAAYDSGRESAFWHQLRSQVAGSILEVTQDIAARAVPLVMSYFAGNGGPAVPRGSEGTSQGQSSSVRQMSSEPAPLPVVEASQSVPANKSV